MSAAQLPAFVQLLLDPTAYPHPVPAVELVQTHISYVFLAGPQVYKFKKPVDFGFLDFTTLERRHHFCQQELLLNRRLAPSIYQGLVTVTDEGGRLALNGAGPVVEYGIRMARMPAAGMMGRLISEGRLGPDDIDRIVATLVPFYAQAAGGPEIGAFGRAEAVAVNITENFRQTEGFVGSPALSRDQFDAIVAMSRRVLADHERFDRRVAAGRIRDCHGDLYSANICLADQVYIFDCIEFNERFRYADVASDLAFLAMDLEFHCLTGLAQRLVDRFVKASGDEGLPGMLDFYKCYRAYVRGKINLFTAHAPEVDAASRQACQELAGRYFRLAATYAA
ncbi:MAG: hypothetical protein AB1634_16280 [Thermodesulfobacteriota bacterium]